MFISVKIKVFNINMLVFIYLFVFDKEKLTKLRFLTCNLTGLRVYLVYGIK